MWNEPKEKGGMVEHAACFWFFWAWLAENQQLPGNGRLDFIRSPVSNRSLSPYHRTRPADVKRLLFETLKSGFTSQIPLLTTSQNL